ncbi:hypothetical protein ACFV3N_29465 [Streptomyces bauhiniae]|uniref:hypothetical protein n=1 Tax=Streptomyces bauhiniae TaxID=2340725 RepID=UPI003663B88F
MADNIESDQLGFAAEILEQAQDTLDDADAEPDELHSLARDLAGALRDVLRVAISRGYLLAVSDPHTL